MSTLIVKAKVLLASEEQMEAEGTYDLGNVDNKTWVWRRKGILADEIYDITEYNKTKCIIEMMNESKILVQEPFDELYEKWIKAKLAAKGIVEDEEEEIDEETATNGGEEEEDD